jgi:hypothetical protein
MLGIEPMTNLRSCFAADHGSSFPPAAGKRIDEPALPAADDTAQQFHAAVSLPSEVRRGRSQGSVPCRRRPRHRSWQRHTDTGEERGGTFIRHAFFAIRPGSPSTIVALAIAMVLSSFRTPLVATVGGTMLLAKGFRPTPRTAVALSPVTPATDPEDFAACVRPAKPLTENQFGTNRHPRPKAGLDNGYRSWQGRAIAQDGYLMKVAWGDPGRLQRSGSPNSSHLKRRKIHPDLTDD